MTASASAEVEGVSFYIAQDARGCLKASVHVGAVSAAFRALLQVVGVACLVAAARAPVPEDEHPNCRQVRRSDQGHHERLEGRQVPSAPRPNVVSLLQLRPRECRLRR